MTTNVLVNVRVALERKRKSDKLLAQRRIQDNLNSKNFEIVFCIGLLSSFLKLFM